MQHSRAIRQCRLFLLVGHSRNLSVSLCGPTSGYYVLRVANWCKKGYTNGHTRQGVNVIRPRGWGGVGGGWGWTEGV